MKISESKIPRILRQDKIAGSKVQRIPGNFKIQKPRTQGIPQPIEKVGSGSIRISWQNEHAGFKIHDKIRTRSQSLVLRILDFEPFWDLVSTLVVTASHWFRCSGSIVTGLVVDVLAVSGSVVTGWVVIGSVVTGSIIMEPRDRLLHPG